MHRKMDYTCAHVRAYSSFSRALVDPYPKKPLYGPPCSPYLHSRKFITYKRIGPLTCLSLLPDQQTHALTISKYPHSYLENSTTMKGTNEVALWAHHPHIATFSQTSTLYYRSLEPSFSNFFLNHGILVSSSTHSHSPGHHLHLAPDKHFSHVTSRYACSC
jgi:hypothetical protein